MIGVQPCGCVLWAMYPGPSACCQEHEAELLKWFRDPEKYEPKFPVKSSTKKAEVKS